MPSRLERRALRLAEKQQDLDRPSSSENEDEHEDGKPAGIRLVARHITEGTDTILFSGTPDGPLPNFLGISNDGRRVLYTTSSGRPEGDAYLGETLTGQSHALPLRDGELAASGTLSRPTTVLDTIGSSE